MVLETVDVIFILIAWVSGIFAWYFGYRVYSVTRGASKFYIYFFFGGLAIGMLLVLRIFGMLNFYETESWLVAYDFFIMVSAILMMLGFKGMNDALET